MAKNDHSITRRNNPQFVHSHVQNFLFPFLYQLSGWIVNSFRKCVIAYNIIWINRKTGVGILQQPLNNDLVPSTAHLLSYHLYTEVHWMHKTHINASISFNSNITFHILVFHSYNHVHATIASVQPRSLLCQFFIEFANNYTHMYHNLMQINWMSAGTGRIAMNQRCLHYAQRHLFICRAWIALNFMNSTSAILVIGRRNIKCEMFILFRHPFFFF